jgi:hypothetical protein
MHARARWKTTMATKRIDALCYSSLCSSNSTGSICCGLVIGLHLVDYAYYIATNPQQIEQVQFELVLTLCLALPLLHMLLAKL